MVCSCHSKRRRSHISNTQSSESFFPKNSVGDNVAHSSAEDNDQSNIWLMPPNEFIYVALSNIVYFVIAGWLLYKKNIDGVLLILVGIVSTVYHLYPSLNSEIVDYVTSLLITAIFLSKYYGKITHRRLFAISVISFIVGALLLFNEGIESLTDDRRKDFWYICGHSLWHVLSAFSVLLLVLSTTLGQTGQKK